MYRLAIFDLDGTILDTLEDLKNSVNFALSCSHMPERTLDEVRCFVGNGIRLLIERAVPEGTSTVDIDRVYGEFRCHYNANCTRCTAPYEGIPALLDTLRKQGILTAVVSNKADFAVQKLCRDYFPGQFDFVAGEKPNIPKKPAPDSVLGVLSALNIPASEAVYIGDSDVDIRTAKNAVLPCISVTWGFRDREFLTAHGAKNFADSPEALLELLINN